MALAAFNPPAGMFNDGTSYSTKGVWSAGDKTRFRGGLPEKIGGWSPLNTTAFNGVCRCIYPWVDLSSVRHIGVGTNTKFYVEDSGSILYDRTPLRAATLPDDPLATSSGSPTLTITHAAHGQVVGNRVMISGAEDIGGFSATALNSIFTIASVPTADTYTVTMGTNAGSTVAAGGGALVQVIYSSAFTVPLGNNPLSVTDGSAVVTVTHVNHGARAGDWINLSGASAVGGITPSGSYAVASVVDVDSYTITHSAAASSTATGGGAAVRVSYELSAGLENYTSSLGWGSGGWGSGGWGVGTLSTFTEQIRLWSMANYGENLVINPRRGPIYLYEPSTAQRAVDIRLLSGAAEAPAQSGMILVSTEDRRVISFGSSDYDTGIFDPLLVRWCDNEDIANWDPADTNATAGFLRISSGSEIVTALASRGEILIWTDVSLHVMRFVEDLIFGITLASPSIDILGPNAAAAADDAVFWMGRESFYTYNGRALTMPCSVREHVFNDINLDQATKVFAGTNKLFREVTWFYPSADSTENNRYVTFNYAENVWYFGTMERSAWVDAGIVDNPLAASAGFIYYHETGWDDGSTNPSSPIYSYIESTPIELEDGERFSFVRRIVPDITFDGSTATAPAVTYEVAPSNWPGEEYETSSGGAVGRSATVPVEQFTRKVDVRIRGRQFKLKVSSDALGVKWRLGKQRFDIRPDGRK